MISDYLKEIWCAFASSTRMEEWPSVSRRVARVIVRVDLDNGFSTNSQGRMVLLRDEVLFL